MEALRLHGHLFGRQGSRRQLNTPVLIVDLAVLDANIAVMADLARRHGVRLRPHSKTHKSPEIARRQIAAGAIGICCAKLGEAEVMVEAGIAGVLITSPVVTAMGIERLIELNRRAQGLIASVDNPANVDALAAAAGADGTALSLVVDIDPGMHRTGVPDDDEVVALADRIAATPSLRFAGVQFYSGRLQHVEDYAQRKATAEREAARLRNIVERLRAADLAPAIVTGAGTGTHHIDAAGGVFSELQVGSYVFMDVQYEAVGLWGDGSKPFRPALFVDTTIISANAEGMATADAGLKAFAPDGPEPVIVAGAPAGASYRFTGDEFGAVMLPEGARLAIGDVVTCQPPHCDPTVNLYEAYHVVAGDRLLDIWPVAGRGRSR